MFTIIGGDGKEYGPVSTDLIRSWIAAGRANLDTKAKAFGTEEWRRVGDYPEFSGTPVVPPAMDVPPAAASPVYGSPSQPAAESTSAVYTEPAERGTRLVAVLLDNLIAIAACTPGFLMFGMSIGTAIIRGETEGLDGTNPFQLIMGGLLIFLAILALVIVQVWMLTTRGQTIGKRIMGIRIVRFDTGANPGFVNAVLLRSVVPAFIGAIPYIGWAFSLVDACFIFRDDRRCLHDLMATTRVVKV